MPSYTYRCKTCQSEFTVEQSIMDEAFTKCSQLSSKCSGETPGDVHRVIGRNVGIQFKGSGFYVNNSTSKETSTSSSKTSSKP